jgi:hypothetical protein
MAEPDKEEPPASKEQANGGWFKPQWYKPLGQFFELASVIVLVCLLGLAWLPLSTAPKVLIAVADLVVAACLFGVAIICLSRAIDESKRTDEEFRRQADSTTHVISDGRLLVLKEEKVARDAFEVLRKLNNSALSFNGVNGHSPNSDRKDYQPTEVTFTALELVVKLRQGLGRQRTNEVKDLVLKYTVRDEDLADEPVGANSKP